ncbi:rhamnulokinase [Leucobacter luti]|uniref:rhamnulokinase n=1 Tax=Leucobacter luti TaxID=340320 RepID=UPI00104AD984|nr:rhamnulokinase family protein [Leucobacter luti]MCW2289213.1 rhamnulokinase [Leucobacter luti]TCK39776.1 rhamnulokinase [Leucobacter luti]
MTEQRSRGAVAAVDLGATSGRVIVGRVEADRDGGVLRTEHVARFANDPVRTRDGLHWNLLELYRQTLAGLTAAERSAPGEIASVGIDSWAVDYGLFRDSRLLGIPYHYRDARCDAGVTAVHARVSAEDLYARNGLQHLTFNTIFQLATEGELLTAADRMLLVPDLLNFWLTGAEATERSNASTTGLLDPRSREWDLELADRAGIPRRILAPLVDAGTRLGPLTPDVAAIVGRPLDVVAVASHDTASAVAAIPSTRSDFAYISCGTWGLVGLELDAPVLTEAARAANFTNEGGVAGTTRFLHNVMGMWLLSESLRHWERSGSGATSLSAGGASTLSALLDAAARVSGPVPVFDVNDPVFMPPGDIPGRILSWFAERGERAPEGPSEIVRSIVESLALAFADAVTTGATLAGRDVSVIHIIGGGSQNTLLCQRLADRSGLPVLAGPVEATAMGNMLLQAQALGQLGPELADLRAIVARSTQITTYQPRAAARP